jgi:hypothetical protein
MPRAHDELSVHNVGIELRVVRAGDGHRDVVVLREGICEGKQVTVVFY